MKVAVFGCLHGQLNDMFEAVKEYETQNKLIVDLIIVCGDCQTIRHQDDLRCLAVPNKFKQLGDFHEYYSGKKKVPRLTIFVGGNHEASNYLMTLPYGGWVCDNFYYLGFAGVVKYKGLRIGGVSGIYNFRNCNRGRFERLPLDDQSMRSIYHTRRLDVFRLSLLSKNINEQNQLDVFLSHDWPARVYEHGNLQQLLRFKPHFKADVNSRYGLGSPMTQPLISRLKPRHWFAAHLHCKFQAKVEHDKTKNWTTDFLSLNKIEQGRHYVEFMDLSGASIKASTKQNERKTNGHHESLDNNVESGIDAEDVPETDNELYYDEEWLTVLRKTVRLEYKSYNNVPCPNADDVAADEYYPSESDIRDTKKMLEQSGGLQIKRNFCMAEPVIYNREDGSSASIDRNRTKYFPNPQHVDLCTRLGIEDLVAQCQPQHQQNNNQAPHNQSQRNNSDQRNDRGRNNHYMHPNAHTRSFPLRSNDSPPPKKLACLVDDDGCLPYFVDKKGEV